MCGNDFQKVILMNSDNINYIEMPKLDLLP